MNLGENDTPLKNYNQEEPDMIKWFNKHLR